MTTVDPRPRGRGAEALRNRRTLIDTAALAFASSTEPVPLEQIAKSAGVGIGTLYRHFPSREALVEAVYDDQIVRLVTSAHQLLAALPPAEAFREWMTSFLDWAATKHGMIETLRKVIASEKVPDGQMRARLVEIVTLFLREGARVGVFRADVEPADVAATLAGVLVVAGAPEQRSQAARMLNLVIDALRE